MAVGFIYRYVIEIILREISHVSKPSCEKHGALVIHKPATVNSDVGFATHMSDM
jgi:hypothetical protein